jgi:dTDP-L-rhamnose 4-epimerase
MAYMKNVLITGGAGFIGTNLKNRLAQKGYRITLLDNLSPQIHGDQYEYAAEQNVTFVQGDVRNKADWEKVLADANIIVHYAAETGTGQSMYEVHKYADINVNGTALMLDYLVNQKHKVEKVIIASSRAIYGEGKYECAVHGVTYPGSRKEKDLSAGEFDPLCEQCGQRLRVLPTDEDSKIHPASVYGITKLTQEQMVLNVCASVNIPAVAYRYQNVYGPGQSLKNPYTGILSIFSTLIRNNKNINVFEDGLETRDFVFIDDVVTATVLGIESDRKGQDVYNVGSGVATTVQEVAEKLKALYRSNIDIAVSGNYRIGDIRHNVADLTKIKKELGFQPAFSFEQGITQFANWVLSQEVSADKYDESISQMKSKGLLK